MVRPRKWEEGAVLDAAAAEFRVHGFAATSTRQLCDATGVQRGSLYKAFTSKDELFARALERYVETTGSKQEAVLTESDRNGAARLNGLLRLIIGEEEAAAREGHAAGCMVVGARMTPDLGEHDPRVKSLLDRALDQQMGLVAQAVRVGQLDGSINQQIPPRDAALSVVSLISGLRVLAQTGATPDELRRVASLTLGALAAP